MKSANNNIPPQPINATTVLAALDMHRGYKNGISVRELAKKVRGQSQKVTSGHERRVREAITTLRYKGEPICAHPRYGYFIATTTEELNEACEFLYNRAMTTLTQIACMRQCVIPDLRDHLKLP